MAKTTKRKTIGRQSAQTGTFELIHRVEQHWVLRMLGGLVRLRAEITTVVVCALVWHLLDRHVWSGTGVWAGKGAWLILAVLLLVVLVWGRSRRFVLRRAWCVLTRHRLRACLVGCRVMTHEGRLPRLLWSRPTPVGERVWLWLRPGLSAHHLERITDELAAACLARESRVQAHEKWAVLVRVDIVRHDPLHGQAGIGSDLLAALGPEQNTTSGADVIPLPDRATLTTPDPPAERASTGTGGPPSTTTSTAAPRPRGTSRTRSATTTAAEPAEPEVRGRSGEDVTDYV